MYTYTYINVYAFSLHKFAKSSVSIVKKNWKQEQKKKMMERIVTMTMTWWRRFITSRLSFHVQIGSGVKKKKKLPVNHNLIEATEVSSACLLASVRQNLPLLAEPYASASLKKKKLNYAFIRKMRGLHGIGYKLQMVPGDAQLSVMFLSPSVFASCWLS